MSARGASSLLKTKKGTLIAGAYLPTFFAEEGVFFRAIMKKYDSNNKQKIVYFENFFYRL